jgi:hypothetical protein
MIFIKNSVQGVSKFSLSLGESRGIFFCWRFALIGQNEFVWHLPNNIDSAALIRSGEKNILKKNIK